MSLVVTRDEADKKVEQVRELRKEVASRGDIQEMQFRELEISRTAIKNPKPEKAYRLVNRETKGRVGVLKGYGYKITPADDPAQLIHGEEIEGGQVHGDLVLMETSVENYERRKKMKRQRYEAAIGEARGVTREKIEKMARDGKAVKAHEDAVYTEGD